MGTSNFKINGLSLDDRYVTTSYFENVAVNNKSNKLYMSGLTSAFGVNATSTFNLLGPEKNWKNISSGKDHIVLIKQDGTLFTFGKNNYGQLGLSDNLNRTKFTQLDSNLWSAVSSGAYYTAVIKTDGTLWSWGYNLYGQLGLDSNINLSVYIKNLSSPVQVGSLTNWRSVSSGQYHAMAIKTDGTLWSCGGNTYGQLGLDDRTNRSSPTQVGSLTNWKQVSCKQTHTSAIKTDGTLWSWVITWLVN